MKADPELQRLIDKAVDEITRGGRHASTVLAEINRVLRPSVSTARALRAGVYERLRSDHQHVVPHFLRERLRRAFGDRTDEIIAAQLQDAPVYLRVNTLKTTRAALLSRSEFQPFRPSAAPEGGSSCLRVSLPFGLFATTAFHQGMFEQQDAASQRVSLALAPEPGQRIIDACAGAGGKTLHMAALMQNKGRIIALDVAPDKLESLKERATRAGVQNVETRVITSTKVVKRLHGTADGVLIDAPCSGTGVLRRNPDILWHLTEDMLLELMTTQREILRRSMLCAKPGGRVVFATCSLLPEEGPDVVRDVLSTTTSGSWNIDKEWTTLPLTSDDPDGFYVCVLTRSNAA